MSAEHMSLPMPSSSTTNAAYTQRLAELLQKLLGLLGEESSAASPFLFSVLAFVVSSITLDATRTKTAFGLKAPIDVEQFKAVWPDVPGMKFRGYMLGGTVALPATIAQYTHQGLITEATTMEQWIEHELQIKHKVPPGDFVLSMFATFQGKFCPAGKAKNVLFNGLPCAGVEMPPAQRRVHASDGKLLVELPMGEQTLILYQNDTGTIPTTDEISSLHMQDIDCTVTFPKVSIEATHDLDVLCNLANMSTTHGQINSVKAQCKFELDETGVRASGGFTLSTTRGGGGPPQFAFTKDCYAMVVDNKTKLHLFAAAVSKGTSTVPVVERIFTDSDKVAVEVRCHDGKDDTEGSPVEPVYYAEQFFEPTTKTIRYVCPTDNKNNLLRVNLWVSTETVITPVYISEEGKEEPEAPSTVSPGRVFRLPFPLSKALDEPVDKWHLKAEDGQVKLILEFWSSTPPDWSATTGTASSDPQPNVPTAPQIDWDSMTDEQFDTFAGTASSDPQPNATPQIEWESMTDEQFNTMLLTALLTKE
jgi:hypothetical protein